MLLALAGGFAGGGRGSSAGPAQCLRQLAPSAINTYLKPLAPTAGSQPMALAVLNRGSSSAPGVLIDLSALGFAPAQQVMVRSIWENATAGPFSGSFTTAPLQSHETHLLRITPM